MISGIRLRKSPAFKKFEMEREDIELRVQMSFQNHLPRDHESVTHAFPIGNTEEQPWTIEIRCLNHSENIFVGQSVTIPTYTSLTICHMMFYWAFIADAGGYRFKEQLVLRRF